MCTLHLTVCTKCAHTHRFNLLQCTKALKNIKSNSASVQHVRDPEDPVAMPMLLQRAEDPYIEKLRAESARAEALRAERREGNGAACRTVVKQTRVSLCGCCPKDGVADVDAGQEIGRCGVWGGVWGENGRIGEMVPSGKGKGKGNESYVEGMQRNEGYGNRTQESSLTAQQKSYDPGRRLRMMETQQARAKTTLRPSQTRLHRGYDQPDEGSPSAGRLMSVVEVEDGPVWAPRKTYEQQARTEKGESRYQSVMEGIQRGQDENMRTTETILNAEQRTQDQSLRTEFEMSTQKERDRLRTALYRQLRPNKPHPLPVYNEDCEHISLEDFHMDNEHASSRAQDPSPPQSRCQGHSQSQPKQRQVWQHQSQLQRANRGSGEDNRSDESKAASLKAWKNREAERMQGKRTREEACRKIREPGDDLTMYLSTQKRRRRNRARQFFDVD